MKKQKVSDAVIHRLPRYYRYLNDLYNKGVVRISSHSLGDRMDITASQIRQDLSCFGEFGQQGYGYNVAELRAEIGRILGIDQNHKIIVIGAGHLGHALLQNFDFNAVGFQSLIELVHDLAVQIHLLQTFQAKHIAFLCLFSTFGAAHNPTPILSFILYNSFSLS